MDFIAQHKKPVVLDGGVVVDDRGALRFVNDFDFQGVKRFYQVQNHRRGFIRAWHGHWKEGKYVYVAKGSAVIGYVSMAVAQSGYALVDPQTGKGRNTAEKVMLSDKRPMVLWIPSGYANGAMTLEEDTIIMYFSTATMEETKDDDHRFPYDTWDIWEEDYR